MAKCNNPWCNGRCEGVESGCIYGPNRVIVCPALKRWREREQASNQYDYQELTPEARASIDSIDKALEREIGFVCGCGNKHGMNDTCPGEVGLLKEKPPLGVIPEYIFILKRIDDICRAIAAYRQANRPVNEDWYFELNRWSEMYLKAKESE